MTTDLVWKFHLAATLFMFGLIWLVQVVHYPLLAKVGRDEFVEFNQVNQVLTGWVVGPPMLLEVATLVLLLTRAPALRSSPLFLASAGLLAVVWLSTFLWQVPLHAQLVQRYDLEAAAALVRSNWLRTAAWSARAMILLWLTKCSWNEEFS